MSRPRCNFLIDKHEVILKVTAMKNHSKTMLHADFFLSKRHECFETLQNKLKSRGATIRVF